MKNYYFILSLNIYATEAQIKQAYRQLALKFHPDKNKSVEAEAIFKEINEAYEVLGDPLRKAQYDRLLIGTPAPLAPPPTHRDPRYRPRPNAGPRRPSRKEELLAMMAEYLHYARTISRVSLFFSLVLIADYSLPPARVTTRVVRDEPTRRDMTYELGLANGQRVYVSREAAGQLRGSRVTLYQSAWFSIPLVLEEENARHRTTLYQTIYQNFSFGPIILLITSLLGTFYWKGVEFRFNLGVVNGLLLLLNLVFLQIHKF